jgi:hypothetical protein
MPNRSCGLTPTVYAKDGIPVGVLLGNMNRVFGAVWSTKSTDDWLFI